METVESRARFLRESIEKVYRNGVNFEVSFLGANETILDRIFFTAVFRIPIFRLETWYRPLPPGSFV